MGLNLECLIVFVLIYNSFKTYTTAAVPVIQLSSTNPLSLLGNVDIRGVSGALSSSLPEAGGDEDDEQNCSPSLGTSKNLEIHVWLAH